MLNNTFDFSSTFEGMVVQKSLELALYPFWISDFCSYSYGISEIKGCHIALSRLKLFSSPDWVIRGDLSNIFSQLDHSVLMGLLARKISCRKTLDLTRLVLQISGVSRGILRGSELCSLFTNIYLHELDCFFESLRSELNFGKSRRKNEEYVKLRELGREALRDGRIVAGASYYSQSTQLPSLDHIDPGFCRIFYVRYRENYLVFLLGVKPFADLVFDRTRLFIEKGLHLGAQFHNSGVFDPRVPFYFLGYLVTVPGLFSKKPRVRVNQVTGLETINYSRSRLAVTVSVPYLLVVLEALGFVRKTIGGFQSIGLKRISGFSHFEILDYYNITVFRILEYYKLANNLSDLRQVLRLMKNSCILTLCSRIGLSPRSWRSHFSGSLRDPITGLEFYTPDSFRPVLYFNNKLSPEDYLPGIDPKMGV